MTRAFLIGATMLCVGLSNPSKAEIPCPPTTNVAGINHDVKSNIEASAGVISKVKAADISVKTDITAKNLFAAYPNIDKATIAQMLFATSCAAIRDSKEISDKEKLARFDKLQDKIMAFMSAAPSSAKDSTAAKTSAAARESTPRKQPVPGKQATAAGTSSDVAKAPPDQPSMTKPHVSILFHNTYRNQASKLASDLRSQGFQVSLSVAQFLSEVAAGERPGYLLPGGFKIVFPPEQIGQIDAIAKLAPDILFSQEEEANMPVDKIFVYLSGPRPR